MSKKSILVFDYFCFEIGLRFLFKLYVFDVKVIYFWVFGSCVEDYNKFGLLCLGFENVEIVVIGYSMEFSRGDGFCLLVGWLVELFISMELVWFFLVFVFVDIGLYILYGFERLMRFWVLIIIVVFVFYVLFVVSWDWLLISFFVGDLILMYIMLWGKEFVMLCGWDIENFEVLEIWWSCGWILIGFLFGVRFIYLC